MPVMCKYGSCIKVGDLRAADWLKRLICKTGHVSKDVCASVQVCVCV